MNIPKPTEKELEQGYQVCPCNQNVHILQAGFEVRHKPCYRCGFSVVDKSEFFMHVGSDILSK